MKLTSNQFDALDACRHAAAVRDVAEVMHSTRGAAMAHVGRLLRRGLLRRKRFAGTYWIYTQTAAGRKAWRAGGGMY